MTPSSPMLLYLRPNIHGPYAVRLRVYLAEKQIPSSLVTIVPHHKADEAKLYPAQTRTASPALAIPKVDRLQSGTFDSANFESYTWLLQSLSIIEYLEDLFDSNPALLKIGSLRGSKADMIHRANVRSLMTYSEDAISYYGTAAMIGNRTFAQMSGYDMGHLNPFASSGIIKQAESRCLKRLNDLIILEGVSDMEGLKADRAGAATVGDCCLWAMLNTLQSWFGCKIPDEYAGLRLFFEAFGRRTSVKSLGSPPSEVIDLFLGGWVEGVRRMPSPPPLPSTNVDRHANMRIPACAGT